MQTGAIEVSKVSVCTPGDDETAHEETQKQSQTGTNLDSDFDSSPRLPGPEVFGVELKDKLKETKSTKKRKKRDHEPDTFRKSRDRKLYSELPEAVKLMIDSIDDQGVPAIFYDDEFPQSRRGGSSADQTSESGSDPRKDEPAPEPELAQVQVGENKVHNNTVSKGKIALDYGKLDINSPEVKSWSCNVAEVGELQIGPAFEVHTNMLEIATVPQLEAEVHKVGVEEGQSLVLRPLLNGPKKDDPHNPDEDEDFPPDGSIMTPDDITSTVFRAQYLPMVAGTRPYIEVNFFGMHKSLTLVDSGSQINTFPEDTFNLLQDQFKEKGQTIPMLSSVMAVRAFGGTIVPHTAVALIHFRLSNELEYRNVPFVVIPHNSSHKSLPLLGNNWVASSKSKIHYFDDGRCELEVGGPENADFPNVRVTLVGKERHPVVTTSAIELLPGEYRTIDCTFGMAPHMATTLDNQDMMLYGDDEVNDTLEVDQPVVPADGVISLGVRNLTKHPYTIFENVQLGTAETMASIQESIECSLTCSLSTLGPYINVIELSEIRLLSCLCSDGLDGVVLIINLNRGNYSLLGTDHELISPYESKSRRPAKNSPMMFRGRHLFLWPENSAKKVLTQRDVDLITEYYPKKEQHFIIPYVAQRQIDLPTMESIQILRENPSNPTEKRRVSIPYYAPTMARESERCDKCVNSLPDQNMTSADMYTVSDLIIIFPSAHGTVPAEYARRVIGTEIYIWKVWDWNVTYFNCHPKKVVIFPHMPQTPISHPALRIYLTTILAYLKPMYAHARVKIVICNDENSQNANLKSKISLFHRWEAPFLEAWELTKFQPNYMDYGLKPPRQRKSDDAVPTEQINFTIPKCPCDTCSRNELSPEPIRTCEKHEVIFDYPWTDDKIPPRVVGKARTATTVDDVPSGPESRSSLPKSALFKTVDSAESGSDSENDELNPLPRERFGDTHDIMNVAQLVCDHVTDSAFSLNENPDCPDETELAPIPREYKMPVGDVRDWIDLNHLTQAQSDSAYNLLNKYHSCISVSKDDVRVIKNHSVTFSVTDESPYYLKIFPMPPKLSQLLLEHFAGMEDRGFVIKDLSPASRVLFYSNSFLVPKNSQSRLLGLQNYRIVTNYVELNRRIRESDRGYAMPNLELLYSKFSNFTAVSLFDGRNYFPSHRLTRSAMRFMGLSMPDGHVPLIATTAQLGVRIWPSVCSLTLNCTYTPETRERLNVWIDDFAIISTKGDELTVPDEFKCLEGTDPSMTRDWTSHLALLDRFLAESDNHGLLFSVEKIKIGVTSFSYMGYNLSLGGRLEVPPVRFKVLDDFDFKKCTQRQLQHILGVLQYCSAVLDNYAGRSFALYKKATEKVSPKAFKLEEFHIMCLKDLIFDLKSSVNRYCYNPSLPIEVVCDASLVSASCIVWQTVGSRRFLVRVASWAFDNATIRNCSSLTKEFYAICLSLKAFSYYSCNPELPTIVHTDCKPIYEMLSNCQSLSPDNKLHRWAILLMNMPFIHFKIFHMSSSESLLSLSDFLSRDARLAPRVVTRLSNRLRTVPPDKRPNWGPGAIITTENLNQFITQANLVAFPKTKKVNKFFQFSSKDPFVQGDNYFERLFNDYFLPRLAWPSMYKSKSNPPSTVSLQTQHDGPAESEKSGTGTTPVDSISTQTFYLNEDGSPANIQILSSADIAKMLPSNSHRDVAVHAATILRGDPAQIVRIKEAIDGQKGVPFDINTLAERQARDKNMKRIAMRLATGKASKHLRQNYILYEGCLLCKLHPSTGRYRICLDFESCLIICAYSHLYNHSGIEASTKHLSLWYHSPNMQAVIKAVNHACSSCLYHRSGNPDIIPGTTRQSSVAFEHLVIDHISFRKGEYRGREYSKVLVIVDTCTKYTMACLVPDVTARATADALRMLLPSFYPARTVAFDNARGISGKEVRELLFELGIKAVTHLPSRSQAGSIVESALRTFRELVKINRTYHNAPEKYWPKYVAMTIRQINSLQRKFYLFQKGGKGKENVIKTVYTTSFVLAFGQDPELELHTLLGSPANVDLEKKKEWVSKLQLTLQKSCETKEEIQRRLDEAFESKMRVRTGDLAVLQHHGRYPKNERKMRLNIYRVLSRNKRKCTIVNVWGPETEILEVYAGHLFPYKRDDLLNTLPDQIRLALGAPLHIKPADELPLEMRTHFGSEDLKPRKKPRKALLVKAKPGGSIQTNPNYVDDSERTFLPSLDKDGMSGAGSAEDSLNLVGRPDSPNQVSPSASIRTLSLSDSSSSDDEEEVETWSIGDEQTTEEGGAAEERAILHTPPSTPSHRSLVLERPAHRYGGVRPPRFFRKARNLFRRRKK